MPRRTKKKGLGKTKPWGEGEGRRQFLVPGLAHKTRRGERGGGGKTAPIRLPRLLVGKEVKTE